MDLQTRYILPTTRPKVEIYPAQYRTYRQDISCLALDLQMRYILPSTGPTDKIFLAHRVSKIDFDCVGKIYSQKK